MSLGWNCPFSDQEWRACFRGAERSSDVLASRKRNYNDGNDIVHQHIGSVNPVKGGELIQLMGSAAQQQIPMNKC